MPLPKITGERGQYPVKPRPKPLESIGIVWDDNISYSEREFLLSKAGYSSDECRSVSRQRWANLNDAYKQGVARAMRIFISIAEDFAIALADDAANLSVEDRIHRRGRSQL